MIQNPSKSRFSSCIRLDFLVRLEAFHSQLARELNRKLIQLWEYKDTYRDVLYPGDQEEEHFWSELRYRYDNVKAHQI